MKLWQGIILGTGILGAGYLVLYKHGVRIISLEVEGIDSNEYKVTVEIKNESDIARDGFAELAMDGYIRDWEHLKLQPDENWIGTTEVIAEEEICVCVDTFNKDIHYLPFFLRPFNSKCANVCSGVTKMNDDTIITQMQKLIAETASDARERAISFCRKDGISATGVNIGTEQEVYLVECSNGEKVGDFHTHLDTVKFSVADLINLVSQRNGFSCVGAAVNNKISCLQVIPTEGGFDQWQQQLYEAAEEPLELRELLVHSDLKPQQWLDSYNNYTEAVMEFGSVVRDGKDRGYLVDSTEELLRELSLA